jgi:hypothetical protein
MGLLEGASSSCFAVWKALLHGYGWNVTYQGLDTFRYRDTSGYLKIRIPYVSGDFFIFQKKKKNRIRQGYTHDTRGIREWYPNPSIYTASSPFSIFPPRPPDQGTARRHTCGRRRAAPSGVCRRVAPSTAALCRTAGQFSLLPSPLLRFFSVQSKLLLLACCALPAAMPYVPTGKLSSESHLFCSYDFWHSSGKYGNESAWSELQVTGNIGHTTLPNSCCTAVVAFLATTMRYSYTSIYSSNFYLYKN